MEIKPKKAQDNKVTLYEVPSGTVFQTYRDESLYIKTTCYNDKADVFQVVFLDDGVTDWVYGDEPIRVVKGAFVEE